MLADDFGRMTGKPEVIPETESLHYLQKSQGRPRRRILSTRLVLTSLLVCAKCAQQACTRLLRTAPISRQRQMQVAETAGGLGICKSVASHSKFADTWYLGGSTPPPGTTPKYSRFKWFVLMWNSVKSPR